MFRGATNPYDEPVAKTTDENLTGENWELILNLCDKVSDEGENGAREVIAALVKRLTHRNPNVQLYSLSLAEALSKNCGLEINREIASRAFTASLERLITDRTTHDKVKKRTLAMIQQWASEFENDPTLGMMDECYQGLKAKNYKFDGLVEPPPEVDDSIKKKEEEELQRVLELSLVDKGGRNQWYSGGYVSGGGAAASSGGGASGSRNASTANLNSAPAAASASSAAPAASSSKPSPSKAPATTAPSYAAVAPTKKPTLDQPVASTPNMPAAPNPASAVTGSPKSGASNLVTRVRALHSFEPTELGELAFEKGDIIKVVDRGYKDWWRGQLKGKTGIFPVNYVEPLPEPSQADIAKEVQMEVDVFTQAPSIDKLLTMLRGLDPLKDNLADNDELQELYRQSMSLRPKIVKLIDKYTQKRIELSSMNDNFKTARQMFEAMMEESLAKHSPGVMYDYRQPGPPQSYDYGQQGQQGYGGWNQGAYNGPQGPPGPTPQPPYAGYPPSGPPPGPYPPGGTQDYVQPYGPAPPVDPQSAYAQQYGQQYGQQPPPAPYQLGAEQQQHPPQQGQPQGPPQQYGPQGYPQYAQQPPQQPGQAPPPQQQQAPPPQQQQAPPPQQQQVPPPQQQQQPQPQQQVLQQPAQQQAGPPAYGQPPAQGGPAPATGYQPPAGAQGGPDPAVGGYAAAAAAAAATGAAGLRPTAQQHPSATQAGPQQDARPLSQVTSDQQPQLQQQQQQGPAQDHPAQGPPYVWSATGQYPDPGAQAWAQYYAMGGTDPAGRVYFTPESLPPEGSIPPPQGDPATAAQTTPL
ncbi:ESCRT-0 subunit protein hse1 [Tulasnella sp. JGI-2019a]|nr:ESCRT-0 subunit protein hse1 [Tulasnella sp. JGI-2019a]